MSRTESDPVLREYARLASRYDSRWSFYVRSSVENTVARLPLREGQRVLDVGCGTGSLLKRAAYDEPGALLYGVEPTPDALNLARRRLGGSGERVRLLEGCGQSLPFENNSFDVIALTMVLDELGLATRHQVLGIKTEGDARAIFVDTPGIHILGKDRNKAINRFMNQAAVQALRDVDCVVFLVDRTRWTEEDQIVLDRLANVEAPVILAVNKVDRLQDKATLLPWLAELQQDMFVEINPADAERMGIVSGDMIAVESDNVRTQDQKTASGAFTATAYVTDQAPEGAIFSFFHYPESPGNSIDTYRTIIIR